MNDETLAWIIIGFCLALTIAVTWASDFNKKHLQEPSDWDYLLRSKE